MLTVLDLASKPFCTCSGSHGLRAGHASAPQPEPDAFETSPPHQQAMLDNARAAIVLSRGNRVEVCNRRFAEMMRTDEASIAGARLIDGFEKHADWHHHARAAEKAIRDLSERMLAGVASKYGKDSSEYEMAGGTRKSERKRPTRKTPPAA